MRKISKCQIRIFESNTSNPLTYSCDDIDYLKKKFMETNKTEEAIKAIGRDRSYERYSEELDNLCHCKISDKCDKCSDEDHEGLFCRCESRNIKLAKQKRNEKVKND